MLLFRVPSRRRRSTEAPSKHAQRKGNKLARTGRESSPGPFAGNPCRRTTKQNPHGPRSRQKAKTSSVCEPAQSKRTSTSSKSTNLRYIPRKTLADRSRQLTLCEPAQSKRSSTSSKSTNLRYIPRKTLADRSRQLTLCEPAQSKRTSTSIKSTNLRQIPRKTLAARAGTSIWHQGLFSYRKKPLV